MVRGAQPTGGFALARKVYKNKTVFRNRLPLVMKN